MGRMGRTERCVLHNLHNRAQRANGEGITRAESVNKERARTRILDLEPMERQGQSARFIALAWRSQVTYQGKEIWVGSVVVMVGGVGEGRCWWKWVCEDEIHVRIVSDPRGFLERM